MAACTNCGREQAPRGLDYSRADGDARCWAESSNLDRDNLNCERAARAVERAARKAAERELAAIGGACIDAAGKSPAEKVKWLADGREWWMKAALDMECQKNEAALLAQVSTGALSMLGPAVGEVLHKLKDSSGAEAELKTPVPANVIAFMVEQFKALLSTDPSILNYIEIQFTDAETRDKYAAIIVKPSGKTPHQLRGDAESERDAALQRATEAERERDENAAAHEQALRDLQRHYEARREADARADALAEALELVYWGEAGGLYCRHCKAYMRDGHTGDCRVGAALAAHRRGA